MSLDQILQQFGLPGVAIGTALEGETVLMLASYAAHRGVYPLWGVIGAAFAGAWLADNVWFQIGRRYGPRWLDRPSFAGRVAKLTRWVDRYQIALMLVFRFLVGLRTATPLLLGSRGIPTWQFALLDAVGCAIWSVVIALVGDSLARLLRRLLDHGFHHRGYLIALLIGLVLLWLARRRIRAKGNQGDPIRSASSDA